jgi:hypothetical protein
MDNNNNNNSNNKQQRIVVVVAMITAASLLSLGAVAATTITPVYAGGDKNDHDNGDGVKQKAEAEADCDQKNKVEDGSLNVQDNIQGICAAISANLNDIEILSGGMLGVVNGELVRYD